MSQITKVKLLPISRENLPKMLEWRNTPSIYQWCRQYEPLSLTQHESWFARIQNDSSIKMYSIYDENTFVGVCGLTSIDYINSRAEFSLYISPQHHKCGYGYAALKELLKHGFDVLNLNCIWGEVFQENPAMTLFKKLGFKEEGIRRDFYFRQGRYINCHLISLLKSEWMNAWTGL